jgi:hypothetical protein
VAKKLTISVDHGAHAALLVIGPLLSRFLNCLALHGCATTTADTDQATDKRREPDGCERAGNLTRDIANELRLPQRGEVWWLAFEPSVAAEARKNGATVIVSNDVASRELTSMEIASPLCLLIPSFGLQRRFRNGGHGIKVRRTRHNKP